MMPYKMNETNDLDASTHNKKVCTQILWTVYKLKQKKQKN